MLTTKQNETYQFIKRYMQSNSIAPTTSEIAAGIGIKSRGVVHRYVTALAEAGLIKVTPHRSRNIQLAKPLNENILPIIGTIAAGNPIVAITDHQELNLSQALLGSDRFILMVKGDSMIGDNICDGDYIICEKCDVAEKDDIIVALIDNNEATLKRLRVTTDGNIELIPSNPTLSPMTYTPNRIQIQGKFLGLLRLP